MVDLIDAVALSLVAGSRVRIAEALRAAARAGGVPRPGQGLADVALRAEGAAEPGLEWMLHWIGQPVDAASLARELRDAACRALDVAARHRIEPVAWGDVRYPGLLAAIPDPPPVVWVRGDIGACARPAVAVVGSRAASPYGLDIAALVASELVPHVVVVSGLARGIDSAAHRGALDAGGATVAVLGSGADVIYPPEHAALADRIQACGAIVSELPPGSPPLALHFPARNRVISGLSLAVVVIEAAEKSGSLITAACALEQGREVMAVPGNALSGRNRGSHALIRDGAPIVESGRDVLDQLGLVSMRPVARRAPGGPVDDPVLRCMAAGDTYDLDALARLAGIDPVKLLPRLLELELEGSVRRAGGGRFVRSGRTC